MTVRLLLLLCVGCAGPAGPVLRDPSLPDSPMDVAAPPAETPVEVLQQDGVRIIVEPGAPVQVAFATGSQADAAVALWARQLRLAVAHAVGTPTRLSADDDAVLLTFDSADVDPAAALDAVATLDLSDAALTSAFRTRPDGLGSVTPDAVRAIHATAATREHLALRVPASPAPSLGAALPAGEPLPEAHTFCQPGSLADLFEQTNP